MTTGNFFLDLLQKVHIIPDIPDTAVDKFNSAVDLTKKAVSGVIDPITAKMQQTAQSPLGQQSYAAYQKAQELPPIKQIKATIGAVPAPVFTVLGPLDAVVSAGIRYDPQKSYWEKLIEEAKTGANMPMALSSRGYPDWIAGPMGIAIGMAIPGIGDIKAAFDAGSFMRNASKYTSVDDFMKGEFGQPSKTFMGFTDPNILKARDLKNLDEAQVAIYQKQIREGKFVEPIIVDRKGTTVDGTHRLVAYTREGVAAPVIAPKQFPGLKSVVDLWNEATGRKFLPEPRALEPFTGTKNVTSKFLDNIKGRVTTSVQFMKDLIKKPEFKQYEKDVVNYILDKYDPKSKIRVKDVAEEIESNLLTLTPKSYGNEWQDYTLGSKFNYDPEDYQSVVYESPYVAGGSNHFHNDNYYSHYRYEDHLNYDTAPDSEVIGQYEIVNAQDVNKQNSADTFFIRNKDTKEIITEARSKENADSIIRQMARPKIRAVQEVQSDIFQQNRWLDQKPDIEALLNKTDNYFSDIVKDQQRLSEYEKMRADLDNGILNAKNNNLNSLQYDEFIKKEYPQTYETLQTRQSNVVTSSRINDNISTLKENIANYYKQIQLRRADIEGRLRRETGTIDASIEHYNKLINFQNKSVEFLKKVRMGEDFDLPDMTVSDYANSRGESNWRVTDDLAQKFYEKYNFDKRTISRAFGDLGGDDNIKQKISKVFNEMSSRELYRQERYLDENKRKLEELNLMKTQANRIIQSPLGMTHTYNAYKDDWWKYTIRNNIRDAANDNISELRYPTGATAAKIEGFVDIKEGGVSDADVGDLIDDPYYGGEARVLSDDGDSYRVIASDDIENSFDYDNFRNDEINAAIERVSDEIDDSYEANKFLKWVEDNLTDSDAGYQVARNAEFDYDNLEAKDWEDIKSKYLDRYAEEEAEIYVDENFTDARSAVEYLNENLEHSYYIDDNDRIYYAPKAEEHYLEKSGGANEMTDDEIYDEVHSNHPTIFDFYDTRIKKYLEKLRGEVEKITDDYGNSFWSIKIDPKKDKGPVNVLSAILGFGIAQQIAKKREEEK